MKNYLNISREKKTIRFAVVSTEKYLTFKSVYVKEAAQFFLCDFIRETGGNRYRILIDTAGSKRFEAVFVRMRNGYEHDLVEGSLRMPVSLKYEILWHISQAEKQILIE